MKAPVDDWASGPDDAMADLREGCRRALEASAKRFVPYTIDRNTAKMVTVIKGQNVGKTSDIIANLAHAIADNTGMRVVDVGTALETVAAAWSNEPPTLADLKLSLEQQMRPRIGPPRVVAYPPAVYRQMVAVAERDIRDNAQARKLERKRKRAARRKARR